MNEQQLPEGIIKDRDHFRLSFPPGTAIEVAAMALALVMQARPQDPVDAVRRFNIILSAIQPTGDLLTVLLKPTVDLPGAIKNKQLLEQACATVQQLNITQKEVYTMMRGEKEFPKVG